MDTDLALENVTEYRQGKGGSLQGWVKGGCSGKSVLG